MYLNFPRTANQVSFLMPPVLRAWPNVQVDQRGLMRFRIADFVLGYKLTVETRKRQLLLCYMKMFFSSPIAGSRVTVGLRSL